MGGERRSHTFCLFKLVRRLVKFDWFVSWKVRRLSTSHSLSLRPNLSSFLPLICITDFTFSLAARGSEERRTTACGLELLSRHSIPKFKGACILKEVCRGAKQKWKGGGKRRPESVAPRNQVTKWNTNTCICFGRKKRNLGGLSDEPQEYSFCRPVCNNASSVIYFSGHAAKQKLVVSGNTSTLGTRGFSRVRRESSQQREQLYPGYQKFFSRAAGIFSGSSKRSWIMNITLGHIYKFSQG